MVVSKSCLLWWLSLRVFFFWWLFSCIILVLFSDEEAVYEPAVLNVGCGLLREDLDSLPCTGYKIIG